MVNKNNDSKPDRDWSFILVVIAALCVMTLIVDWVNQ